MSSARLSSLEQRCAEQRQQQHTALAAVSSCIASAISSTRDRLSDAANATNRSAEAPSTASLAWVSPQHATSALSSFGPSYDSSVFPPTASASASSSSSSSSSSVDPMTRPPSAVRLSDLCAADKAKVGRLLVALANNKMQQQKADDSRRWQEEKEQLDAQLAHSMALLTQYQHKLRSAEEEKTRRDEADRRMQQSKAARVEETHRQADSPTRHQQQQHAGVAAIAELHRQVAEQQASITERLERIMQQTTLAARHTDTTTPQPTSPAIRADAPYEGATRQNETSNAQHPHDPYRAASTSTTTAAPQPASPAPSRRESEEKSATALTHHPQRSSSPPLSLSLSGRASPHLALSVPMTASPVHTAYTYTSSRVKATSEYGRSHILHAAQSAGRVESEEASDDSESEDEVVMARSHSPVSRRIERLLSIQRGQARENEVRERRQKLSTSSGSNRPPRAERPHTRSNRPRHASHTSHDADDAELHSLVAILNTHTADTTRDRQYDNRRNDNHNRHASAKLHTTRSRQPSASTVSTNATTVADADGRWSHLDRFDAKLVDVIDAVDTWR